jgi:nucleotide-binding universal stress UspA family protein
MFKHILLPTDGSTASQAAVRAGCELARALRAQVTGFHVAPRFSAYNYMLEQLSVTREDYEREMEQAAESYLAFVRTAAEAAGLPCETAYVHGDKPFREIVNAARERHCDLIVMGSHGRSGFEKLLLGSQTQQVLVNSQIPVLVMR